MDDLDLDDALSFMQLNPALFCKANAEGPFLWLSPGWSETLGYTHEELLAVRFLDHVHPDDLQKTYAAMARLEEGAPITEFVNRYRSRSGAWVSLAWQSRAANDVYYALAVDVSDVHERNMTLEQSFGLLGLSEELAELGHWRVDAKEAARNYWSPGMYRVHGLEPREERITLEGAMAAYHEDDRARVLAHMGAALHRGEAFDFQHRVVRPDGGVRTVLSRGRPERDEAGQVVGVIGIVQDITDRERLQGRLAAAERNQSVSTLAAGIAHEINNPLQYVMSSLSLARESMATLRDSSMAAELGGEIDDALEGVQQVAQIVQDLKLFLTTGDTRDEPVELDRVLSSTVSMVRNDLRRRARLEEHLQPVPKVQGRYSELIQVFVNLLTNAAQALENKPRAKSRVKLSSRTDARGWAVVEIEDNGCGISVENLPFVFDPFFTTKPVGSGTGLGLHVSRSIVRRLEGDIVVSSEPGRTRFRVELPPASDAEEALLMVIGRPRVLVVDDDDRVARTTARMLAKQYAPVVASSAAEGLRRIRDEGGYAAVISDIMMPETNGWEFMAALAELDPALVRRSLLVTGAAAQLHRPHDALDIPVLEKPFGPQALRDMVAAQLG